jgi:hypothetical protein
MQSSRTVSGRRLVWATVIAVALSLAGLTAVAAAKDRNQDGLPDRWEQGHGLSLKVDQARRDQDGDSLRNRGEYRAGTDPQDADTDGDGVTDADEGAGTITAWDPDTGELTIALFGGDEVTATVTDETQIECSSDDATEPDDPTEAPAKVVPGGTGGSGGEPPQGDPGHGPTHAGEHDCDGTDCSVDDLAVDGVVQEANLKLTADGLVFDEIQLG